MANGRFLDSLATNNRVALLASSAVMAAAIALGSFALARGLVDMKRADREVTVRGVAQRDVTANRASWSVRYSENRYDLAGAMAAVDEDTRAIRAFLEQQGFSGAMTEPGSASVAVSDEYIKGEPTGRKVFSVSRTISFTTADVAAVQKVQGRKDALARGGIVVDSVDASYEYTQLDKIKPDMIAEATRDARGAAEKFASDSGSSVGKIKSARQGYFSVSSRDAAAADGEEGGGSGSTASSPDQRVRVVTTIDYYLD